MKETLTVSPSQEEKKKPNWVARVFIFIALALGVFLLSSCTQAFMSDADLANIMYAYAFGQDSYKEEHPDEEVGNLDSLLTSLNSNSIPRPTEKFLQYAIYADYDYDDVLAADSEGNYKVEAFPTAITYDYAGAELKTSAPQNWIQSNLIARAADGMTANDREELNNKFGRTVIDTVVPGSVISADSESEALATYIDAFQSVKAMAIFGGFNEDGDVELWLNFKANYASAQEVIGIENCPVGPFVNNFMSQLNSAASSNRAGLNTSGEGGMYGQPGEKIYITAKSWGEAFSEYGFLEGLLVWPFGWLLNSMVTAFSGLSSGWAEFIAIMLLTFTVRIVLLVLNFFVNQSQLRMTMIQPEIAQLQTKYPNSETNREEKMALGRDTMALYKKYHIKPWLSLVVLVVQFPLFICVWAALEGSAMLSSGSFYGIELTTSMMTAMSDSSNAGTQTLAIFLFIFMTAAQIFSSQLPMWFQSWKQKRFTVSTVKVETENKSAKTMKYVSWFMTFFVVIMGFSLPAAMSIYWYFGAIMSLLQTLITEMVASHNRHKGIKNGDSLSAIRRSKHHTEPLKSVRGSR